MIEEIQTRVVPPYLSVAKLDQLFKLLETHSFPKLAVDDLVTRKFSKPDAFLAIQTLKFLGMLSSDGKPADKMRILSMRGEGKEQKFQEIIRSAYVELFKTVPSAELLSRAQLHDDLMAVYSISNRLATTAAPLFLWLCNKAGIKTTETVKQTKIHTKARSTAIKRVATLQQQGNYGQNSSALIDLNISHTGIRLLIPKNEIVDDAIASGALGEARQKIIEFAEKVGLKGTKEEKSSGDIGGE